MLSSSELALLTVLSLTVPVPLPKSDNYWHRARIDRSPCHHFKEESKVGFVSSREKEWKESYAKCCEGEDHEMSVEDWKEMVADLQTFLGLVSRGKIDSSPPASNLWRIA